MNKKKGHIPIRMCIVCKERKPKFDLIRLVADKNGIVRRDDKGRLGGRGAYVCPKKECIEQVMKRPSLLCKALKRGSIKIVYPIGGSHE